MPVYNVRPFLSRAVESVLAQSLTALELIAIDDGSTDGCAALLDEYAASHPQRLKVIHQANAGMSAARNRGLELSCGEYVAFLDSDDYVSPDFYARLYARARAEDAEICRGEYIAVDDKGTQRPCLRNALIRSHGSEPLFFNEGFWTALYRRSFLEAHALRFPRGIGIGSDIMFLHQAALCCIRLSLEDEALYYYYRHADSDTAGRQSAQNMQDIMYSHRFILESVYRHQTRISPEAIIHLCQCNIGGLLYYAPRAERQEDARRCRALVLEMLERIPAFARPEAERRLRAAGAPL